MIIKRDFYQKRTLKIAQNLLGCFLVRKIGKTIIKGMITETEAYVGEADLASHATRGRTPRTEIMYGEAGRAYVYLVYGMHYCLNVVTEKKNFPAAVLIRGVKLPVTFRAKGYRREKCGRSREDIVLNGPGKVCRHFKIDRKLNGWDLTKREKLWLVRPSRIPARRQARRLWRKKHKIKSSKRIGIDYAKHCRHYLWRFHIDADLHGK